MNRWTPYLSVLLVLVLVGLAAACPMCKDSISSSQADGASASLFAGNGGGVAGGFNYSIYIMILGFFSALGLVIFNIVRGIRR